MSIQPNYELAKKIAKQVINENCIIEPPIDTFSLVNKYGLKLSFIKLPEKFSNVAGFIDFKTNKVYVSGDDSPNRQAFTVAHELGHWLLHKDLYTKEPEKYQILLRQPINGINLTPEEKEANCFAARLLVPKDMLMEKRKKYPFATINNLAELFAVSYDVMSYRIQSND